MFGITTPRDEQPATYANGGTIGFKAKDRTVDAWYPGERPRGTKAPGERDSVAPIYGAYMRDPDGNKFCAFCPPGI